LATLLFPAAAGSETLESPDLTLNRAITEALEFNPQLAASFEGIKQARAGRDKAFAMIQPSVRLGTQYQHNDREVSFDPSSAFGGGTTEVFEGIYGNLGIIYENLFEGGLLEADDCENIALTNGFADCSGLLDAISNGNSFGSTEGSDEPPSEPVVIQPKEQFFVSADVSWPLSPRVVSLARAGNQEIAAATADVRGQRDQLLGAVIQAYARALHAQQATALVQVQNDRAARHVEDTQLLFDTGMITRDALLRAKAQKARSDLQTFDIREQHRSSRQALALLMGNANTSFGALADIPEIELPQLEADDWIDRALSGRPELAGAEARAKAAREMEIDAVLQMVPAFSLSANWRWSDQASGFDSQQTSWWVGVGASVPLWDGGLMIHGAREASSRKRQAKELARATRQAVQAEVLDALGSWQRASKAVPVAELEFEMSEEAHRLVVARYQTGTGRQLEVLESLAALQNSEHSLLKAQVEVRLAAAALLAAGGSLEGWIDSAL